MRIEKLEKEEEEERMKLQHQQEEEQKKNNGIENIDGEDDLKENIEQLTLDETNNADGTIKSS